jgi:hypothetical protein
VLDFEVLYTLAVMLSESIARAEHLRAKVFLATHCHIATIVTQRILLQLSLMVGTCALATAIASQVRSPGTWPTMVLARCHRRPFFSC